MIRSAAIRPTSRPARTEPVNDTRRTFSWETKDWPTALPVPVTTLKTPSSKPISVAN